MAKLTIIRLSQHKNRYGSFCYRVTEGEPEEGTNLYGDDNDILFTNQKIGVWNEPIEVEQYLRKSKSGKMYSGFSIDQELNSFAQRGHTATLAVRAGLDAKKIAMLKMISELDEQELRVEVIRNKMLAAPSPAAGRRKAVSPPEETDIEDAEILEEETELVEDTVQ